MSHLNVGFWELRERQKNLEDAIDHALERNYCGPKDDRVKVGMPKNIRKAYFDIFKFPLEEDSIRRENPHGISSLESDPIISFQGVSRMGIGANFTIDYFPEKIALEISSYSFNGKKKDKDSVREIGLFSTELDEGENIYRTHLKVGDSFKYHSGFSANHNISKVISYIQESEVLPHIPEEILSKIPGCDIIVKEKEEMEEN